VRQRPGQALGLQRCHLVARCALGLVHLGAVNRFCLIWGSKPSAFLKSTSYFNLTSVPAGTHAPRWCGMSAISAIAVSSTVTRIS